MLSDAHAHLQDLPGGGLFSTYVTGGLRENSQQQAIFQNVCVCSAMAEGNQAKWSVFGCHAKEMIEPQAMASQAKLMASGSKAMMTLSFVALICPCEA